MTDNTEKGRFSKFQSDTRRSLTTLLSRIKFSNSSPKIVYSKRILQLNTQYLRNTLKYELKDSINSSVLYSVKANDNVEVLSALKNYVDGFDIASGRELDLLRSKVGIRSMYICATGSDYTAEQISSIISHNGMFYFDNLSQLKRFISTRNSTNKIIIGIRVNTDAVSSPNSSRFGFHLNQIEELAEIQSTYNFKITSLLLHTDQKNMDRLKKIVDVAIQWTRNANLSDVVSLNFGGSWDDIILKQRVQYLSGYINQYFSNYSIALEPGSFLVRTSGVLIAGVSDTLIETVKQQKIVLDVSSFNISSWFVPSRIVKRRIPR